MCQDNYGGSDCFVKTDEPPNVSDISRSVFCDLHDENCDKVIIYNNNSVNVDTLSCFLKEMKVNISIYYNKTGDLNFIYNNNIIDMKLWHVFEKDEGEYYI